MAEGPSRTVLVAVMAGAVLGPIDASIVNVILPTIAGSLGASLAQVQWVPMVYLLTGGSLVLLFGRLGDVLGYREVFLGGLLGFVVTSVLCAAAPSVPALVAARALQGLTSGMLMSVPLAILTRTYPPAERGKVIGLFASSISIGLAVGPSLGGLLAAAFGWRAAFLVNVPVGLLAFAYAGRVLPRSPGTPGRLDVAGGLTWLLSLSSFLLFVNRAQQEGLSGRTVPLLLASLGLLAAFLVVERRTAEPMLDLSLLRRRTLAGGSVAAVLNFMAQYAVVFATPFFLARVLHEGPASTGLVMTAFPLAVLCVAPFAGALSDRVGTVAPAATGALLCSLAALLLAFLPAGAGPGSVAVRLSLFGLGTGLFQSPNNSAVMGSAPRERLGVVSSLLGTSRTLGMSLGIAAAGAILYAHVPAAALRAAQLSAGDAARFLLGLRVAYGAAALFAAGSALLSAVRSGPRPGA